MCHLIPNFDNPQNKEYWANEICKYFNHCEEEMMPLFQSYRVFEYKLSLFSTTKIIQRLIEPVFSFPRED